MRRFPIIAVVAVLASHAGAQERPDTPKEAAEKILVAWTGKDSAALRALAGRDAPDPWLVADELCARGEHDAAHAFAIAAPRNDVEKLPEHVDARRKGSASGTARAAVRAANKALSAKDFAAAIKALEGSPGPESDRIAAVLVRCARAAALRGQARPAESAEELVAAGRDAADLGWFSRAAAAFNEAGRTYYRFDRRRALVAWQERLTVEEKRGNPAGVASALTSLGAVHLQLRKHTKALEYQERALKLRTELGDRAGIASSLVSIGIIYKSVGKYATALEYQERALRHRRELGDRVGIAGVLINIGILHKRMGNYPQALDHFERGLADAEAAGHRPYVANAVASLGNLHHALGNMVKALKYQERALKLAEVAGDRAGVAATLINTGLIHNSMGNYGKALAHHERGLAEAEGVGHRRWAANALANMGYTHLRLGNYAKARECQERALQHNEAVGNRAGIAAALNGIGGIHSALGEYEEAQRCQERVLAIRRESKDRAGITAALINIGSILSSRGEYGRALEHYEQGLAEAERMGHRQWAANALANLGFTHSRMGSHAKALAYHERALALKDELGDRAGVAAAVDNIGVTHMRMENYEKARQYHERALTLREALKDRVGVAATLLNIGNALRSSGEYEKALEYHERGLAEANELGHREWTANALGNIGRTHARSGKHAKAVPYYLRALAEAESLGASDPMARTLQGLAASQLALGDPAAAAESCRDAVAALGRLASGLAEEEGARIREEFVPTFEVGIRAGLELGDPGEVCYFIESGRAATLLEALGGRSALRAAAVPEELRADEAKARDQESRARGRYSAALVKGDLKEIRETQRRLGEARERVADVIARIQRSSKAAANVTYPTADSIEEIRSTLRERDVFVLYAIHGSEAAALVMTRDSARIVELGNADRIQRTCAGDPVQAVAHLRAMVVDPLELPGECRVLISPAGALCYVPFVLLLGDREIVYVPSGTTYGVLLEGVASRGEGVLALGDPDYNAKPDPAARTRRRDGRVLVPLPGTRDEAKAVGDVLLLGSEATETALLRAAASRPRWRAVHLACHGLVDPERPRFSSLALSGGDFLTTLEVFRSKVHADLVVLSACETAKGKIYLTEGVVGFVRAFMFAGSPRVLVSLWKVDDEATRELMVGFYKLWNPRDGAPGLPTATALKQAQQLVASHEKWKRPHFWAAWQLWGMGD